MCVSWHCNGLMRCQCETVSTPATTSVSTYTKLNTPEPKHGPVVDGGSAYQGCLYCSNATCWIQPPKKRNSFFSATRAISTKGLRADTSVASNRAQVVRTYTLAQAVFPYPLSPAPFVIIERVSHLSHLQRASVSQFWLHPENSPHYILLCFLVQDWRLFALQLLAAQSHSVHPLRHHLPTSLLHPTPDR